VEVSPGPAEYARRSLGAPVFNGTLRAYRAPAERFDLVTMIHVLEHLRDPVGELEHVRSLLAPSGSLLVEVPNAEDALLSLFGGFYRPLCPGDHVSFFDKPSLERVLRCAGFEPRTLFSPTHARDIIYGSLMSSLDYLRTRGGRRMSGSGGVETQVRYRGRLRRPLKKALDLVVEAVDPAVVSLGARFGVARGAVWIAHAVPT
jgi:SAM-dependent methyltransferase